MRNSALKARDLSLRRKATESTVWTPAVRLIVVGLPPNTVVGKAVFHSEVEVQQEIPQVQDAFRTTNWPGQLSLRSLEASLALSTEYSNGLWRSERSERSELQVLIRALQVTV